MTDTTALINMLQALIGNMGTNTLADNIAALTAIQNSVAQEATAWAAYVAGDITGTTTTADPRIAITTEAQQLLAQLQTLLQTIQNYTGNQTGVPGFVSNTTSLIAQVQDLINNMMNNPASVDATTLANLNTLTNQEVAAWNAYVASDVTIPTTIDPRLALLAEAQSLLLNLSSLSQDIQAFTGNQTGVPTFSGLTGDLTTQVQNLINSIMSSDYATSAALLSNLENFAAQDTSAWTAYKDSNTTPTTAASKYSHDQKQNLNLTSKFIF